MKYLFLFFSCAVFSQNVALNKEDEFTKTNIIQVNCAKKPIWTVSDNINKEFGSNIFLSLSNYKYKDESKNYSTLNFDIALGFTFCLSNYEGKTILLFEDQSTLTLIQTSRLDCSTRISAKYYITDADIAVLMNKNLSKIRIYTSDGYIDFEVKEKKIEIIRKTFKLFHNTIQ